MRRVAFVSHYDASDSECGGDRPMLWHLPGSRALCRDFATHDKKVLTIAAATTRSMRQPRRCSMICPW
jgi:hypothetical protein